MAKESGGSDGVTFEDLIISKVSARLNSIHSVVRLVVASKVIDVLVPGGIGPS